MMHSQSLKNCALAGATALTLSSLALAQQEIHALSSSDGVAYEYFAHSIDLGGNRIIAGSYAHAHPASFQGAAHVFDATTGQELWELLASDGESSDSFGLAVATDGIRALVGANSSDFIPHGGAAYLFDVTTGQELRKLHASDGVAGDAFGGSLAIGGPFTLVGASHGISGSGPTGAVYVFDTDTGSEQFKLQPLDREVGGRFGWAVAINGNLAVIGAYLHTTQGTLSGSAYIFDVSTGQQLFKLIPSDGLAATSFGYSVDIDGDRAIVGARKSNAAYVFDVTTGKQVMRLTSNGAAPGDFFGNSVGISGGRAVVGAHRDDDNGFDSGAAYVFDIATGAELFKLKASSGATNDLFAKDARMEDDTVLIGALFHDQPAIDAGTAFVYALPADCNENGIPDAQDLAQGTSLDMDGDSIPDECGNITPFCFGDGSGQPCPCGNSGSAGEGCHNSAGRGALAFASESTRVSVDDLLIGCGQLLPGKAALLFSGQVATSGNLFGDGLLCAGSALTRFSVRIPDSAGTAQWGPDLGAHGGWNAGDTRHLQVWYRDPQGACGFGFNLSNGLSIGFQP